MKKLFIIIAIAFMSTNVLSQNKGDMYLMIDAFASFGTTKTHITDGLHSINYDTPSQTTLGLGVGYGFFAVNNLRLELCVGIGYESTPTSMINYGKWLYNKELDAMICPNMSYYVKITDRFYYIPEFGINILIGSAEIDQSANESSKYTAYGVGVYGYFCAFELRATDKFAFGLNIGSVQYIHIYAPEITKYYDLIGNKYGVDFNKVSIIARFYL